MKMGSKKAVERLLPIYGGGSVPRVFHRAESMQKEFVRDTLYSVGDNTTSLQLRKAFDAQAFAWFTGTYHNFMAIYHSSSGKQERQAAAHIANLRDRSPPLVPFRSAFFGPTPIIGCCVPGVA